MRVGCYLFDMLIAPLTTRILTARDDLAEHFSASGKIRPGDILVISSKAVAMTEGVSIDLNALTPSKEALEWSKACGRSAEFCEAVILETRRLNGKIVGCCQGALLTRLKPFGMHEGTLLVPSAGLDESNVEYRHALGWPHDPVASLKRIREALGIDVALILTDSCCVPTRKGVTAFALACAGMAPFTDEIGKEDLFGKRLRMTVEATADQLSIAANAVMGNAAQATPAALIRDHGIPFSSYEGWVSGMDPENDLFKDIYHDVA